MARKVLVRDTDHPARWPIRCSFVMVRLHSELAIRHYENLDGWFGDRCDRDARIRLRSPLPVVMVYQRDDRINEHTMHNAHNIIYMRTNTDHPSVSEV